MPKPTDQFPKDGDPAPDDNPTVIDPPEGVLQDDPEDDPPEDPLKALQKQLDDQKRAHADEIAAIRRQIPPASPKPTPEAPKGDETDWDNLMFSDPKKAVALIKKQAKEETQAELRAEYQREQGTTKFWNSFYAKHQEFKRDLDHDLIELTLNSNLQSLANIPVTEALDKLADLTRDRILRYAGGKPKGKKAVVEGAEPPTPRGPPKAPDKRPASLSDVIAKRKDARRTKRTVAA